MPHAIALRAVLFGICALTASIAQDPPVRPNPSGQTPVPPPGAGTAQPPRPLLPPSLREERRGRSSVGDVSVSSSADEWETWWLYNREALLDLSGTFARRSVRADTEGDEFVGRRDEEVLGKPALLHRAALRARLVPILTELVTDKSTIVRAEAALALGKIGGAEEVATLRRAASERAGEVRELALLGLGLTGDPSVIHELTAVIESSSALDRERVMAALALGLTGSGDAARSLVAVAFSGEVAREVRAAALLALGALEVEPGRRALWLAAAPTAGPSDLRSVAVLALGRRIDLSSIDEYLQWLGDAEVDVRRSAALGLGRVAYRTDLWREREDLVRKLRRWDGEGRLDADARRELEDLITKMEERATATTRAMQRAEGLAVQRLARALDGDADPMVRSFSAIALGRIGSPEARQALAKRFARGGNSNAVRGYLALGLGLAGGPEAGAGLASELGKRALDPSIASAYALALGFLGHRAAGPVIEELATQGGSGPLRGFAGIALGLMNYRESRTALRAEIRESRVQGLRPAFAVGLGLLGDAELFDVLEALALGESSATSRIEAVESLAALRDITSVDILIRLLESRASDIDLVRAHAVHALGQIAEKSPLAGLEPMARDWNWTLPFPLISAALLR